jgi:hypothetical protein
MVVALGLYPGIDEEKESLKEKLKLIQNNFNLDFIH